MVTDPSSLRDEWEREAERWIAWARTPDHDSYWRFHRRRLLGLLPPPGRLTVDLGCGEGRVTRDLSALGHHVIGVDASPSMVTAAADVDDAPAVVQGDAAALPLGSGVADLVVAFMSLHDVDELEATLVEIARVLGPGGRAHLAVVHPLNSAGSFADTERGSTFALERPYFGRARTDDLAERDGLTMRFVSEHRALDDYARAVEAAGLLVETVREPTETDQTSRWADVPLFLHLGTVKPPVSARLDRRVFHITSPADARHLVDHGTLEPPSLATEGFVHCSTAAEVVATTQRYYAEVDDLVLVELDLELMDADVSWPEVYPGRRFPHVHGPLTGDAVLAVHPWRPADRVAWEA